MLFVGDIHVYVSDFTLARRFWADGLGLEVAEEEVTPNSVFARLDFPEGGCSLRLLGPVRPSAEALSDGPYPETPVVRFDITTSDFDGTLARLLEHGGRQLDEVERYEGLRGVTLADPDGNTFELLEIQEEHPDE